MPEGPAARVTDKVLHPIPPMLFGSKGSPDVIIGYLPAWRGIPAAAVGPIQGARATFDKLVTAAEATTAGAAAGPAAAAAIAAETTLKANVVNTITGMILMAANGSDTHKCGTPSAPTPIPHGPGVVIDGSATVFINFKPACRLGDTILEPLGPPNKIAQGEPTVIIGG